MMENAITYLRDKHKGDKERVYLEEDVKKAVMIAYMEGKIEACTNARYYVDWKNKLKKLINGD
jgi:hypothetical protein